MANVKKETEESRNENATATTGNVMEAEHLFILMNRNFRISRNVRAQWYFQHLNKTVHLCPDIQKKTDRDLEVIGVYPNCTSPEDGIRLTPNTLVSFLGKQYRFVFILDFSPSTAVADAEQNCVLHTKVFESFRNFLMGLVQPFRIPSNNQLFSPQLYITVLAYTPYLKNRGRQALLHGCLVNVSNLYGTIRNVEVALQRFFLSVTKAAAMSHNGRCNMEESSRYIVPADSALIDMIRFSMLAIQLLPENTSAGMIVFTDGVLGLPDVATLQSLLSQLRVWTISCSFVLIRDDIGSPDCAFGKIPNTELMRFLASATFGVHLNECPNVGPSPDYRLNMYHKAVLCWSFQRALEDYRECAKSCCAFKQLPCQLLKTRHFSSILATSLQDVLAVRLREGYTVKKVVITGQQIKIEIVLPWKYEVNLEYAMTSDWPPLKQNPKVKVELLTEGPYEFLSELTALKWHTSISAYRISSYKAHMVTVQSVMQADKMLVHFNSFRTNPVYFTLPDQIRDGMPLFYMLADADGPVVSSHELQHQQYTAFCQFWRPICTLDMNIWQKWLHTHRISSLLTHDTPLSSHLHLPSPSNRRYGSVSCRLAMTAIENALKQWATFTLMDNHSYIKFEYSENDSKVPSFFYIIRPSFKPPCMVIRLAFLGGIHGSVRNRIVVELTEKLLSLQICKRASSTSTFFALKSPSKASQLVSEQLIPVNACIQLKKPIEKILVRYDKMPTDFMHMVQFDELSRSDTSLNSVLCRYFHCKRYLWSLKRHIPGLPMNAESAASILQTIVKRRLNEGFHFAYSCEGFLTLLKEYEVNDTPFSSCTVQYVLFPPSILSYNLGYDSVTRESIRSDNDHSEMESIESDSDAQLVTELWIEPQLGGLRLRSDGKTDEQVSTRLDLFEQVKSSDGGNVAFFESLNHQMKQVYDVHWLAEAHDQLYDIWTLISERLANVKAPSMPWLANVRDRLAGSDKRIRRLPQFVCYAKSTSDCRLAIVLCPASFEDVQLMWQAEETADGKEKRRTCEADNSYTFPLFAFNCCRTIMSLTLMGEYKPNWATENNIVEDFRVSRRSDSVIGALHRQITRLSESDDDTIYNKQERNYHCCERLHVEAYCSMLENLYSKAYVAGVYRALLTDAVVHSFDVITAVDGKCEESVVDVELTEFLGALCNHWHAEGLNIDQERTSRRSTMDTEKSALSLRTYSVEENASAVIKSPACGSRFHTAVQEAFRQILKHKFKPIGECPDYYYYAPPLELDEPVAEENDSFGAASREPEDEGEPIIRFSTLETTGTRPTWSCGDTSSTVTRASSALSSPSDRQDSSEFLTELTSGFWRTPVFLHLTCSIRLGKHIHSCSVRDLPVCLVTLLRDCGIECWDEDWWSNLDIQLDLMALTPQRFDEEELRKGFAVQEWSGSEFDEEDSDEENICTPIADSVEIVSAAQHAQLLETVKEEVSLLLKSEIVFSYNRIRNRELNAVDLRKIMEHVTVLERKHGTANAVVEHIPVAFVMQETESFRALTDELQQLHVLRNYRLITCDDDENLYYVIAEIAEQCRMDRSIVSEVARPSVDHPIDTARRSRSRRRTKQQIRSQSFGGFLNVYYEKRQNLLRGRWSSMEEFLPFDIPSETTTRHNRRWSEIRTPMRKHENSGDSVPSSGDGDTESNKAHAPEFTQQMEFGEQAYFDFWLVVDVSTTTISCYLLERSPGVHDNLWQSLIQELKAIVKRVNQAMLLNDLCENRICDNLLVQEREETMWKRPSAISSEASRALRTLLNKLAVSNRENMFVYKEASKAVFYLRLHERSASALASLSFIDEEKIGQLSKSDSSNLLETIQGRKSENPRKVSISKWIAKQCMEKILLTVHGVRLPSSEIVNQLVPALQHRLDDAVLSTLLITLERNPTCKLTRDDVEFLQPKNLEPSCLCYFTLPPITMLHLYSFSYYLRQHILEFCFIPNYASPDASFRPYVEAKSAVYFDHGLFLYHPRTTGAKGIAIISHIYVDRLGYPVSALLGDPLEPQEGFAACFRSGYSFESLTKIEPIEADEIAERSIRSAVLQFAIWERGDAGLTPLSSSLEKAARLAIYDLVTEYGLLTAPLSEGNSTTEGAISEPGSPTRKTAGAFDAFSQTPTLRKRHSSAAMQALAKQQTPTTTCSTNSLFSFENLQALVRKTTDVYSTQPMSAFAPLMPVTDKSTVAVSDAAIRRRHNSHQTAGNPCGKLGQHKETLYLNPVYADLAPRWFEFCAQVASSSVQRWSFSLEAEFSRVLVLREVVEAMRRLLENDVNVLCFAERVRQLGVVVYETFKPSRPPVLVADEESTSLDDTKQNYDDESTNTFIIVAFSLPLWRDTMRYGRESSYGCVPDAILNVVRPSGRITQAFPLLLPSSTLGFVPRQRIAQIVFRDREVTAYAYNWPYEICNSLQRLLLRLIYWHNARSRLLKQICLHKIGLFQQPVFQENEAEENPYYLFLWSEAELFITCYVPPPQLTKVKAQASHFTPFKPERWERWQHFSPLGEADFRGVSDTLFGHGMRLLQFRNALMHEKDDADILRSVFQHLSRLKPDVEASLDEELLRMMINRSRLVHFVYTPLLFCPAWREKLAVVRRPENSVLLSVSPVVSRSRHDSGSGCKPLQNINLASPMLQQKGTLFTTNAELWHMEVQKMMLQNYVRCLCEQLSMRVLAKKSRNPTGNHDENGQDVEAWVYRAAPSNIVLMRCFYDEPYFSVQVYVFDATMLTPNADADDDDAGEHCYELWNAMVAQSHLHSFAYDFHMRLVASYASGEPLAVFKPGYNMNAFLIDFLQYYTCRPPFARTYVFEDRLIAQNVTVSSDQLYNYILDHDKMFGLRVVRMRVSPASSSDEISNEYLLTSHGVFHAQTSEKSQTTIPFQVLHVVLRDCESGAPDKLSLKFYVIFVDQTNIFPQCTLSVDESDNGKYHRVRTPSWIVGESSVGDEAKTDSKLRSGDQQQTIAPMANAPSTSAVTGVTTFTSNSSLRISRRSLSRDNRDCLERLSSTNEASTSSSSFSPATDTLIICSSGRARALSYLDDPPVADVVDLSDECFPNTAETTITPAAARRIRSSVDEFLSSIERSTTTPSSRRGASSRQIEGTSLHTEQVTYLTYVTNDEFNMQKCLAADAGGFKERLKTIVKDAASHCKRDLLWQKLLIGVSNEGNIRKKDDANGISLREFELVLKNVHSVPLHTIDKSLEPLLQISSSSAPILMRILQQKYGTHCRHFISNEQSKQYMAVLNSNYLDSFILVACDRSTPYADLRLVYKDFSAVNTVPGANTVGGSNAVESRLYRSLAVQDFYENFIHALAFYQWTRLLP